MLRPGGGGSPSGGLRRPGASSAPALDRRSLLADTTRKGTAWCRAYSRLVDDWLAELLQAATNGDHHGVALVAVGGFGRSELCPQSDVDVMLLHERHAGVADIADRVWYPVWDEGVHLGHSVAEVAEAMRLADDDLDTATALLSARHVAGDQSLTARLAEGAATQWARRSKRWLSDLEARVDSRHQRVGEVAFRLEPDIKDGRGGLRDVHALKWAQAAGRVPVAEGVARLAAPYSVLLDARVELHRATGRTSNVLVLQEQDAVATALGDRDADALMARIAEAARTIAWISDDTWHRIRFALNGPLGRVSRHTRPLGAGIQLRRGEVHVDDDVDVTDGLRLLLEAAVAAAAHRTVLDGQSLDRLVRELRCPPGPWPAAARDRFAALLAAGPAAVRVIESLDHWGLWVRVLPEWEPVRARPQRNAYHRWTVDRHLLETTANASRLAPRVDRPDLLALAALLHDLGKGYDGDHSQVGAALAEAITRRMGYPDADVADVAAVVRHHLLLSEVATRRDLDDPTTIERVASAVGSRSRLELLAALTEADSLATGPSAWGSWKAQLVAQLVERVRSVIGGDAPAQVVAGQFPRPDQLEELAAGGDRIAVDDDVLTVMVDDRPGIFSRVAGVLALHGLDVVAASAYSSDGGRALAEFRVAGPARREIPWPRVSGDLDLALGGRLALNARLAERARTYDRWKEPSVGPATVSVLFDNEASATATVIDVRAPDGVGVLYRITRALADLDLDIRTAKVETLGAYVHDAFYVRGAGGAKITDPSTQAEIERAIVHGLAGGAG